MRHIRQCDICDMWYVICDMWYVTFDMWHAICDTCDICDICDMWRQGNVVTWWSVVSGHNCGQCDLIPMASWPHGLAPDVRHSITSQVPQPTCLWKWLFKSDKALSTYYPLCSSGETRTIESCGSPENNFYWTNVNNFCWTKKTGIQGTFCHPHRHS